MLCFTLLQKDQNMIYHKSMPKKTLILIIGLVVVTIILFVIAVQTGKQKTTQNMEGQTQTNTTPTPDVAHTVLSMSPNPAQVAAGKVGTVDVMIDPSDNQVTAVQLEVLYDPSMVSNVKIIPGALFPNAAVLLNKNNVKTGRYTFAYGIQPNQNPITMQGVAATITFTARGAMGQQSEIILQPTSLVTSRGIATSVLKEGSGTTVVISSGATGTTNTPSVTTQ